MGMPPVLGLGRGVALFGDRNVAMRARAASHEADLPPTGAVVCAPIGT
jgi:hypothetical protein